jgi:hypothetical protein
MPFIRRVVLVLATLALPIAAFAQEAVLTGTVTDATNAVLPGVTITATNSATGNTFVGVTDERGVYRLPARVGTYVIKAELSGFTTVERSGVDLLVGQTANINLQLMPSTVQETITVTGEAPLLNITSSSLGGNVDPRQVQELPVNGRNWMALALLAPGSRTGSTDPATPLPDRNGGEQREFQLNVDGQQVSADIGTGGQPRYSQDAIAEFQFVSNRFDATMGRSTGIQVNAITKSGTNKLTGLFRTNFRSDRFNADNPVLGRKIPQDNQQYSGTVGGPLVKDKLHYFGNYEYEREPTSITFNTPYPAFNSQREGTNNVKKGGGRLDYQVSPSMRLMGKVSKARIFQPFGTLTGVTNQFPSTLGTNKEYNDEYLGQFTQVLSSRALNEIKVGEAVFGLSNENYTTWSNHWQKANGITTGSPRITFTGFSVGGNQFYPRHQDQWVYSGRDDFTYSYDMHGRHDLRTGGEFLYRKQIQANCRQCMGTINATGTAFGLARPTNDQLQAWFPDPFNVDTWNLNAISPWVRFYQVGVGDFDNWIRSQKFAAWAQDDWRIGSRLTLNLGVRYDLEMNAFANDTTVAPWQFSGRPNDTTNFQPRLGFAYQVNDMTVLRGGSGLYYGDAIGADQSFAHGNAQIVVPQYDNPAIGAASNFATDPTAGRGLPTYSQALTLFCYAPEQAANYAAWVNRGYTGTPACLRRSLQEFVAPHEYLHLPRTWQTSIGVERQVGQTIAIQADYVFYKGDHEKDVIDNVNLTFDPNTKANIPVTNIASLVDPAWGVVSMNSHLARSQYSGLQTAVTKRYSNRWQASATYTLSWFWNAQSPPFSGLKPVPFDVAGDFGDDWSLADNDQRHRAVFNGIWQVGKGFQLSGLHYLGAGIRSGTNYGGNARNAGGNFDQRLRPDGTLVPRNSIILPQQNRTDFRVQWRAPLPHVGIDLIAETFNVFNRPNWSIETQESSPDYKKHTSGQFRQAQFGFRVTF